MCGDISLQELQTLNEDDRLPQETSNAQKGHTCCRRPCRRRWVIGIISAALMLVGIGYGGGYLTTIVSKTSTKGKPNFERKDLNTTAVTPTVAVTPASKAMATQQPKAKDCSSYAVVFKTIGETPKGSIRFQKKGTGNFREQIIRVDKTDDSKIHVSKPGWYRLKPSICMSCPEHQVLQNHSLSILFFLKNGIPIAPDIRCYAAGHCGTARLIWLRTSDTVQVAIATKNWNNELSLMEVNRLYCT